MQPLEEHPPPTPANPSPNTTLPTLISPGLGQAQTTVGSRALPSCSPGPLEKGYQDAQRTGLGEEGRGWWGGGAGKEKGHFSLKRRELESCSPGPEDGPDTYNCRYPAGP